MLNEKLLIELQEFVERHLIRLGAVLSAPMAYASKCASERISEDELEDFIRNNRKQTFSQVLFGFIDKKGVDDPDIYRKAGIDRRHFSKIRSNPGYHTGKNTVVALALALELNKKEADELLGSAGFTLSDSDTFDLVIQFCLNKKIYNINDVNLALDYFSLKPLGALLE